MTTFLSSYNNHYTDRDGRTGYLLVAAFFVLQISGFFMLNHMNRVARQAGIACQGTVEAVLYARLLVSPVYGANSPNAGELVSLFGADLEALVHLWNGLLGLLLGPIELLVIVAQLYYFVQWAAFGAIAVVGCVLLLYRFVGMKIDAVAQSQANLTAKRYGVLHELLHGIKDIKASAAEAHFAEQIIAVRAKESRTTRRLHLLMGVLNVCGDDSVDVISLVVMALLALVMGQPLLPSTTFTVWIILGILHGKIFNFPEFFDEAMAAWTALTRVAVFISRDALCADSADTQTDTAQQHTHSTPQTTTNTTEQWSGEWAGGDSKEEVVAGACEGNTAHPRVDSGCGTAATKVQEAGGVVAQGAVRISTNAVTVEHMDALAMGTSHVSQACGGMWPHTFHCTSTPSTTETPLSGGGALFGVSADYLMSGEAVSGSVCVTRAHVRTAGVACGLATAPVLALWNARAAWSMGGESAEVAHQLNSADGKPNETDCPMDRTSTGHTAVPIAHDNTHSKHGHVTRRKSNGSHHVHVFDGPPNEDKLNVNGNTRQPTDIRRQSTGDTRHDMTHIRQPVAATAQSTEVVLQPMDETRPPRVAQIYRTRSMSLKRNHRANFVVEVLSQCHTTPPIVRESSHTYPHTSGLDSQLGTSEPSETDPVH
ncbi:hypothetical protein SARC_03603 [Sphaeroforma arctica JP610]|uniref:ABC transmembrane type-1 domain-containing protein n=1 Tax=Sphaeroforma arctica JP610 TaxID=667725 RepID=A0A0L0G5S3_9EUKA|nr:hypothetical protein SARC_03603 [Sphaeroforma arctica JP610]KNC84181.1 hypothetical protein SARC_03603 [Sphaeroforma arctica JP610]|eukprot:XP_014158083.1 hypothetical protein SARC_03603 [Sphaeroforma arctica JP610]